MALALDAIRSARTYLNDTNAMSWSDGVLMPLLQQAFGELQLKLGSFRIPVIKNQIETVITAGTKIFPNLPNNITSPISIHEKDMGVSDDFYEEMVQVTFLPSQDPELNLLFWAWRQQQIEFVGATSDRYVRFRYNGYLTTPNLLTDPLGFIFAEQYLGPRTAALALASVGQKARAEAAKEDAKDNLYLIMQYNVTEDQRPVRRKKYRSNKGIGDIGGFSVPVGSTSAMPQWIAASNQPNGIDSVFTFSRPILYLDLNGTMLFPGINYISVGTMQYSLIDNLGNVIIPSDGWRLMGQVT